MSASILPFVRKSGDDEVTACSAKLSMLLGESSTIGAGHEIVYEVVASRIIGAAKKGEQEIIGLVVAELAALGLYRMSCFE